MAEQADVTRGSAESVSGADPLSAEESVGEGAPSKKTLTIPRRIYVFIKKVVTAYVRDDIPLYSAAIAFYAVMSLPPIMILSMAMANAVAAGEVVRHDVVDWVSQHVGSDVAALLDDWAHVQHVGDSRFSVYMSVVVLAISASRLFAHIQTALDHIWHIQSESAGSVLSTIWARIWGLAIIGIVGTALILGVVVKLGIRAAAKYFNAGDVPLLWVFLDWTIYFFFVGGLVYLTYRHLPKALVQRRHALIGAAITAVLLIIGGEIIAYYVANTGVTTSFGAAGSVMALVLWVYYASQVFLTGAVITWLFAEKNARVRKRRYILGRHRKELRKDAAAHPKSESHQEST